MISRELRNRLTSCISIKADIFAQELKYSQISTFASMDIICRVDDIKHDTCMLIKTVPPMLNPVHLYALPKWFGRL